MAIKSNNSTDEVIGGIKLYSGITNMNILAVNPSMDELHAMEIKVKQEPNYNVDINGEEYFKLVLWLGNNELKTRMEILLQDKPRVSKSGKNQWLNNVGQSTWSDGAPTYDWWKNADTSRKAYVGEETLIDFIKAWANVANGDEVYFESIGKIVKGDVSEVKALVGLLKANQVRVLVGVKDGKYQQVYMKHFGRIKPQRDDFFVKKLNDDYGSFNADFNVDLQWGTYTPNVSLVTPDAAPATVDEGEDWV